MVTTPATSPSVSAPGRWRRRFASPTSWPALEATSSSYWRKRMRLEQELDRRTAASGLRFPVSLTIGSAHSRPPHAISLDDLLQQADQFMYEHKHRAPPQAE